MKEKLTMDDFILTALIGTGLVCCGFFLGRTYWITSATKSALELMIQLGYLRTKIRDNGDVELLKFELDNTKEK